MLTCAYVHVCACARLCVRVRVRVRVCVRECVHECISVSLCKHMHGYQVEEPHPRYEHMHHDARFSIHALDT